VREIIDNNNGNVESSLLQIEFTTTIENIIGEDDDLNPTTTTTKTPYIT